MTVTEPVRPTADAATAAPAVQVEGLTKFFGAVHAVDDVTFAVAPGEVFAFLGPNGAGKSTTINILCTLARPTAGRARVAGYDVAARPQAVRRRIGLVFQEPTLDVQLTAEEDLRFHAVMYRVPPRLREQRIKRVLDLVALADRKHDLAVGADTVELHTGDDVAALAAVRTAGYQASAGAESLTVFTADGEAEVGRLVEAVGGGVLSVSVHRPTLDDVFLHYTGRQIRDQDSAQLRSGMARAWRMHR